MQPAKVPVIWGSFDGEQAEPNASTIRPEPYLLITSCDSVGPKKLAPRSAS